MEISVGKIISLVLATANLVLAYWFGGPKVFSGYLVVQITPLACIWFDDELGELVISYWKRTPSPGYLVNFVGWIVLLVLGLINVVFISQT